MDIIFCSTVVLVSTFNTRDVHSFITKNANIPVNLVPLFNGVSFFFCCFIKSGVTNELKSRFSLKERESQLFIQNRTTICWVKRQFGQHMYGGELQLH